MFGAKRRRQESEGADMRRIQNSYLDGFVAGAGLATITYGLAIGNTRASIIAGAFMMFYEAGNLALELYENRRQTRLIKVSIESGDSPLEIVKKVVRLP